MTKQTKIALEGRLEYLKNKYNSNIRDEKMLDYYASRIDSFLEAMAIIERYEQLNQNGACYDQEKTG